MSMAAMNVRTAVLLACMVFVPGIAMFSHKVPAESRAAIRACLLGPLAESLGGSAPGVRDPSGPPAAAAADADARDVPQPARPPSPSMPHPDFPAAPAVAAEAPEVAPMFPARVATAAVAPPAPGPGVGAAAAGSPGTLDRTALEGRLTALGATQVEWTPAQGGDGIHRCSCRLPADPSGQLHRVFQASGTDPLSALDSLVGQVTAWSLRHGSPRPAATGETAAPLPGP